MTALEAYDAGLIELNKVHAPSLLLDDYNYFFNKAIQQYINLVYTRLEINQQALDDIRALKRFYEVELNNKVTDGYESHYRVNLPGDYMHLANCIVKYTENEKKDCAAEEDVKSFPARRLSPDLLPQIVNNSYLKPTYNRPYYSLFDIVENKAVVLIAPTEPESSPNYIEIYNGTGLKNYTPSVYIEYIKEPEKIELTEAMLSGNEKPKELEFPDYVCYEIVNIFVRLVMENASNPRLQTNMPLNNTIAIPQQS